MRPCPSTLACAIPLLCLLAVTALQFSAGAQQADDRPAARYEFADAADPGRDASGEHSAKATNTRATEGFDGRGIQLEGDGGLEVPFAPALSAGVGFAIECRLRFADVAQSMNLISKSDEYLLRLDPPAEGGTISFFVNVQGSLEPRVRGPMAKPDTWYHIVATWDGKRANLWVNGQLYSQPRAGVVPPQDTPVLIGLPSKFGPMGFRGVLDMAQLHPKPLSPGDLLRSYYALDESPAGDRESATRFEFTEGLDGWEGRAVVGPSCTRGALSALVQGAGSLLMRRGLATPAAGNEFLAIRMTQHAGRKARATLATSAGTHTLEFATNPDGRPHSYILHPGKSPQWGGEIQAIVLEPSDEASEVSVDFVRLGPSPDAPAEITVRDLFADPVILRAGRPVQVTASIENTGGDARDVKLTLAGPAGIDFEAGSSKTLGQLAYGERAQIAWSIRADEAVSGTLTLTASDADGTPATATLPVSLTPSVDVRQADYVPEPSLPPTDYLVGAHYCPLWKQGSRGQVWEPIVPWKKRTPALGFYDEHDPEVTDWEIKWALDHGIQYFVYCWYRTNQGQGVDMFLSHAIHEGLFNSRYEDKFKFTIMWENQSKGSSGVASEEDLLENLLPFWIETYFKRPSYLKVDNKPLLFIYRPEYLVDDLGSVENVRKALDKCREACRAAGFDGLTILGEYRGTAAAPLQKMVDEGLDYSFSYCWPLPHDPDPQTAVDAQEAIWERRYEMDVIPDILTVSMGWDSTPWHGRSHSVWRLPPEDFQQVSERARDFMDTLPEGHLGRKLVLLDNWNEFGEGHYITPHRQYGFGYLDATRNAFCDAPEPHVDLVPEDLGLGPYETLWQAQQSVIEACQREVRAEEGLEPDLIGWWRFDEDDAETVAFDWSGNRLGGVLDDAVRVPGRVGKALHCNGGNVLIPINEPTFGLPGLTVECWVRTDTPNQTDKWFVNCIYGTGESGFRLGLSGGKPTWAIPLTAWSHHLVANERLPLGRWVHVAATCDGATMRLFMDGRELAALARPGEVHAVRTHLSLGSYDTNHAAHFTGLLDEVRILSRALTPAEIATRAQAAQ